MSGTTNEYLSKDILEKYNIRAFAPFRILQKILGTCRVDVRDRFITAPTFCQKFYTITCLISVFILYANVFYMYLNAFFHYPNIYYACMGAILLHFITSSCNIIHVRFFNGEDNAEFYLKMQNTDKIMKIDQNKAINAGVFETSIYTVIMILFLAIFMGFLILAVEVELVGLAGLMYSQITFTLELSHCSNIMIYFYVRLRFINCLIINHLDGNPVRAKPTGIGNFPSKARMCYWVSQSHSFENNAADVYLKELLDGFYNFQELYKFQVLLFCVKFVPLVVIVFYFVLLGLQRNVLTFLEYTLMPLVTLIDLFVVMFLTLRCDVFLNEAKSTKRLCTAVMALNQDGPIWVKAKKMLKMIEEKPPKFSVYNMWDMDGYTILKIFNVVSTLFVTLLQFMFL